jgi:uncharacterized protein involved in exopolysaccharide biosynthesis
MVHAPRRIDDSQDDSLDLTATKEMLALVLRAPLRRPKLSAAIFGLMILAGVFASFRASPVYEAQAAIVVQKNAMLPTFGDSTKNVPSNDIDPAAGVSETVKSRDNLTSLARQMHLADRMDDMPNEPMSEEDKLSVLAKMLERRLKVTSDGTTVTFVSDWSDPQTAYDLVSGALHNFLDSRTAAEVAIVSDAIELLEQHAQSERDGIDVAMEEFLHMKDGWKTPASSAAPRVVGAFRPQTAADGAGVARQAELAKRLEEIKQQTKELQEDRRRQLSELNAQMAGILGTLTPSHPTAIGLKRKIEALSEELPSVTALKNEERGLLNQLAAMAGAKDGSKASAGASGQLGFALPSIGSTRGTPPASKQDLEIVDPASAMALSKLQSRIRKYEEFMDQISAAKLQLDLARNAFKYRYSIYKPAEVPTRPKYPIRLLLIVGGALLGFLLSTAVASLLDVVSGRFVEPWQVKRKLSLPILGEVLPP